MRFVIGGMKYDTDKMERVAAVRKWYKNDSPLMRAVFQVSDGKLMETQTANYFSDIYPIDCAVLSANA